MKLDKRHLVASLALLVGSIIYNVWVFTRPATGTSAATRAVAPIDPLATAVPDATPAAAAGAPLDPAQVKPLPDVTLDRVPGWPRNPFADLRPEEPPVVEAAPEPVVTPEVDPMVATILYSSDRRLAMIDGRIVRVGDRLGTAIVVDILPNEVVIESPDRGRRTLSLRPLGTGVNAQ